MTFDEAIYGWKLRADLIMPNRAQLFYWCMFCRKTCIDWTNL